MKSTGIIRKVDELGRVVIPKEIRELLEIMEGTPMEVFVEDSKVIFKKYETSCLFCSSSKKLISYNGKLICSKCVEKISNITNTAK